MTSEGHYSVPVSERRGLSPEFDERDGFNDCLVKAPLDAVVAVLCEHPDFQPEVRDLLTESLSLGDDDWDRAVFVYQLRGHEWTRIESARGIWDDDFPVRLSRGLGTLVFTCGFESTGGGFSYTIHDHGKLVENYMAGEELTSCIEPRYEESGVSPDHAEIARMIAREWRIDSTDCYALFSERGTKVDLESQPDREELVPNIVAGLGTYLACEPWPFTPNHPLELQPGWNREDFQRAKLMIYDGY